LIKQEEIEAIREYISRFKLKVEFYCSKEFNNTEELVLQIEKIKKRRNNKEESQNSISEEGLSIVIREVKELTTMFKDLKINE
ncbi:1610_t:CDS:2, partial [Scutellospora calospora]